MRIGIVDGISRVADGQRLGCRLTIDVVVGSAVGGEVGGFVDDGSGLGVGAGGGSVPEGTAEVDVSKADIKQLLEIPTRIDWKREKKLTYRGKHKRKYQSLCKCSRM